MRRKFGRLQSINKTNLNRLQQNPGVYGIYSGNSKLLKVGRAKRNRPADRIQENAKEISSARRFGFIPTSSVKEAIRLETKIIKDRKPPLNTEKQGK